MIIEYRLYIYIYIFFMLDNLNCSKTSVFFPTDITTKAFKTDVFKTEIIKKKNLFASEYGKNTWKIKENSDFCFHFQRALFVGFYCILSYFFFFFTQASWCAVRSQYHKTLIIYSYMVEYFNKTHIPSQTYIFSKYFLKNCSEKYKLIPSIFSDNFFLLLVS